MPFLDIKVGDKVTRMLAGTIPMVLEVNGIDDNLIYCGEHGWTFDRDTGQEIDEELGWTKESGMTGSYLLDPATQKPDPIIKQL